MAAMGQLGFAVAAMGRLEGRRKRLEGKRKRMGAVAAV